MLHERAQLRGRRRRICMRVCLGSTCVPVCVRRFQLECRANTRSQTELGAVDAAQAIHLQKRIDGLQCKRALHHARLDVGMHVTEHLPQGFVA